MKPLNHSISSELISAVSALNTDVTYKGPLRDSNGLVFISDAEPLVKHSIEHIYSAINIASKDIRKDLSTLRSLVYPLLKEDFNAWEKYDNILRRIEQKL